MTRPKARRLLRTLTFISLFVALGSIGLVAAFAHGTSTSVIHLCVAANGHVRVVSVDESGMCRNNETL